MPDIDFPVNPSLNATYSKDGKTWIWDGSRWRTNNILSYSGGGTGYASYTTGDLLVGTGNSLIKFPVGQNNFQYLRVDSVNSASGVTWISLPLAGSGQSGLVSTLTQTFSGAKTFSSDLNVSSVTPSTNTITGALTVAGGAGIAGTLHAYALTINGTYDVISSNLTTTTTTPNQVLFLLDAASYRSAKIMVQIKRSSDYEVQEILIIQDGLDTFLTQYAQLLTTNNLVLATFDADLSGGNMRLLVTPVYANMTFKLYATAMRD